jgi:hypothetical protein
MASATGRNMLGEFGRSPPRNALWSTFIFIRSPPVASQVPSAILAKRPASMRRTTTRPPDWRGAGPLRAETPSDTRHRTPRARSEAWLERSNITCGYLFTAIGRWGREVTAKPICDHQLAKIIKRLAVRAGLSAASFSGHSLRSGLATSAAEGGATERAIMEQDPAPLAQTGAQVHPPGSLFKDNAAARSGL